VPVPRLFPDTLLPCGSTQIPALDENQERICMSLFLTYCLAGSWLNTSAPFKILLLMHQALQALPSQSHEVDSLARVSQAAFFALEGQESRGHSHYTASSSSPPLAPASGTRATLPAASQRRAVGGPATGRRLGHPPTTKGVCPRISFGSRFRAPVLFPTRRSSCPESRAESSGTSPGRQGDYSLAQSCREDCTRQGQADSASCRVLRVKRKHCGKPQTPPRLSSVLR
jgi:hypothetical protein